MTHIRVAEGNAAEPSSELLVMATEVAGLIAQTMEIQKRIEDISREINRRMCREGVYTFVAEKDGKRVTFNLLANLDLRLANNQLNDEPASKAVH